MVISGLLCPVYIENRKILILSVVVFFVCLFVYYSYCLSKFLVQKCTFYAHNSYQIHFLWSPLFGDLARLQNTAYSADQLRVKIIAGRGVRGVWSCT